ncbi:MAG: 2-hydroxychromene-2-carboxylate isomerase [Hydrogenophaga sp.]|uniref:2-hydroxychromene-2-carboxylate isomerase n=1 Tax=Hydrogenophaga sp. TaxID=1904254 RepID=UPI001E0F34C0|nr:2-hydroxychromene-2-carboxylate isomerase [Hydrogenophaga sp.]MBX3611207.1 2-hydroxychromene-2-carboxylate isomerase [Hydrogenophaga sp.]
MREVQFFYDPISPYAHLAFAALPGALMGHSVVVRYRPVLFAALLKAHGQLGPAEIPAKRDWTYRQVQWHAHANGIRLDLPAAHPFNPLPLLRLGLSTAVPDQPGDTSRYVTELLFQHVWHGGADAADPDRLSALQAQLQDHMAQRERPWVEPDSEAVKQALRANTDEALALGLFGVPAMVVDDRVFWGFDALPMLKAWLANDAWFDSGAWEAAANTAVGVQRR